MRRNFVFFFMVPVLVASVVTALFVDRWVESGLEYAGERAVGARVEVDNLELSLFPLGMEWARMQVADPRDTWRNLFETGVVRFRMDAGQLLRAKFIIETMEVNTLLVGSKRTSDGALPREPEPKGEVPQTADGAGSLTTLASPAVAQSTKSAPSFDLDRIRKELKIDSLLNARNLETYVLIDSLTREVKIAERQWDSTLVSIQAAQARMAEIEKTVRAIDVNAIKTVQQAQSAFDNAKKAYEGSVEIVNAFQERKKTLSEGLNRLSGGFASIDDAAQRDYRRVVQFAKIPDVSMTGLAELILGREILQRVHEYLGYVDMVREKVPQYTSSDPDDAPRRFEGRTIHFPTDRSYPKLWIKQILISGGGPEQSSADHFFASGRVADISTDQRATGKPILVDVDARRGPTLTTSFDATVDRRTEIPHDHYLVNAAGIPMGAFALGNADFLPGRISDARAQASVEVDVPGGGLESNARVSFSNLRITFDRDPRNQVERLTREVLSSAQSFFLNLRLWKKETGVLDVAFATDLDNQLSSRVRAVIGNEVARLRAEIKARVDAQILEKKRQVMALYNQKRSEVQKQLAEAETLIRQKYSLVEQKKKELEDRILAEKKRVEDDMKRKAEEELKKKAGNVLKGILKKN